MKTIFKYIIEETDSQNVMLPKGAKILCVQNINTEVVLYALVDPNEKEKEARNILIFGTGHKIAEDGGTKFEYIGTVLMNKGTLVWHVFEYTGA